MIVNDVDGKNVGLSANIRELQPGKLVEYTEKEGTGGGGNSPSCAAAITALISWSPPKAEIRWKAVSPRSSAIGQSRWMATFEIVSRVCLID